MDIPVNYLAILASGVVAMALGFLWYGPLFGKAWANLMGWGTMTPEQVKAKQKEAMPGYIASFVGALVMAYILSHVMYFASLHFVGYSALQVGLSTAFFNWLGFIAPVTIGVVFWDGKPWKLWFINAGYFLAQMLIFGAILSLWP